jgi:hypothetical protein
VLHRSPKWLRAAHPVFNLSSTLPAASSPPAPSTSLSFSTATTLAPSTQNDQYMIPPSAPPPFTLPLSSFTLPSTHPLDTSHAASIRSWNIKGAFTLQMSCPIFRKEFQKYDSNLFQENHLRPQQYDIIEPPPGYIIPSRTRRPKGSYLQPGKMKPKKPWLSMDPSLR